MSSTLGWNCNMPAGYLGQLRTTQGFVERNGLYKPSLLSGLGHILIQCAENLPALWGFLKRGEIDSPIIHSLGQVLISDFGRVFGEIAFDPRIKGEGLEVTPNYNHMQILRLVCPNEQDVITLQGTADHKERRLGSIDVISASEIFPFNAYDLLPSIGLMATGVFIGFRQKK